MATFDKRQEGFEKKFAHDEETKFKITSRRNRLLGQWVAQQLGLTGDPVEAYAKDVVAADFEEAGDGDVIRKVLGDFKAKKIDMSEHRIRRRLEEFGEEARKQITGQ
jgi:hypothetical protein